MEITWLGHGSWQLKVGTQTVLLDPFLNDSPTAPVKAEAVNADYVLISHGHFDHVADAAEIANRCDATLIAIFEIAEWFKSQHNVQQTIGMNIGGSIELPFGRVKMTQAFHSSQLPDGSYGGEPAGYLVESQGRTIYFACDTGLFGDMQQIGNAGIDIAVVPIGDLFTMGIEDSVEAVKLIRPTFVLPAHYNTWPPIEADAHAWAQRVSENTEAQPIVLQPGETFTA